MSGGVWLASYVVLWVAVAVLLVMVLALLRQVGVLHARLDEAVLAGVAEPADEGPELGSEAPLPGRLGYGRAPMTIVAFVADGCELSAALAPSLRVVDKQYGDALRVVELRLGARTLAAFEAFNVQATPFVVCVDRDGMVRARGRARSLGQLEDLVASAGAAALAARGAKPPAIVLTSPSGPGAASGPVPGPASPSGGASGGASASASSGAASTESSPEEAESESEPETAGASA